MDIKVDDTVVYTISESDMLLLKDYMIASMVRTQVEGRVKWLITHLLEQIWKGFNEKWTKILMEDPSVETIPANKEAFIALVTARPDYQDNAARNPDMVRQ
jgi:hypothetical protein